MRQQEEEVVLWKSSSRSTLAALNWVARAVARRCSLLLVRGGGDGVGGVVMAIPVGAAAGGESAVAAVLVGRRTTVGVKHRFKSSSMNRQHNRVAAALPMVVRTGGMDGRTSKLASFSHFCTNATPVSSFPWVPPTMATPLSPSTWMGLLIVGVTVFVGVKMKSWAKAF
jgi:hypothetical protein